MIQNGVVEGGEKGGGRTVLVGMKLDAPSRELLTWALVKVAQPGDTVIALHVLGNEIVDRTGKNSLLSLVKAFDSVLDVYEGFCNLKQVDLKLKVSRGSSIGKILVREAKTCSAAKIIVGTSRTHHTIRSSTSLAKYCAKKLPKDRCVLAINSGKIIYQKESSQSTTNYSQGTEDVPRTVSSSNNTEVVSDSHYQNLGQALAIARTENCSVCGSGFVFPETSRKTLIEESSCDHCGEEKANALVPANISEASMSSVTMLVRQLPEVRPGWPLLRHAVFSDQKAHRSSFRQISVVQWALTLPSRNASLVTCSEPKPIGLDCTKRQSLCLNAQNGAIVPMGISSTDHNTRNLPEEWEGFLEKYSTTCRLFKYQELVSATSNFSAENLIGKGGSSRVYKGCLPDGTEVAVKILKQTEDITEEFVSEIEIITALHHKNVVSLLGFCFEDKILLLVYDFFPSGSLEENLHGNKKDSLGFNWDERCKVAVGVAEALDYLHNQADQPVIHRDVKSSNILLSDDFEPQLSDFGLAKWASTSSTHVTCIDVAGTFGYLAPEYFMYGKVNDKIDVYGFGVVLLELISGRKPISGDFPKGQESLVMWAKPILDEEKYLRLLDPCFGNNYDQDEMERMILAAALCIRRAPQARPRMSLVLKLLQGDLDMIAWAREEVKTTSEDYDVLSNEFSRSNLKSHLNLALLDVEDDSLSMGSIDQGISWEDYLRGRWSRSSSFD